MPAPEQTENRTAILSAVGPFACEWAGGVEGPLASWPQLEEKVVARAGMRGERVPRLGGFRLRGYFAKRSSHFAQDENFRGCSKAASSFKRLPLP